MPGFGLVRNAGASCASLSKGRAGGNQAPKPAAAALIADPLNTPSPPTGVDRYQKTIAQHLL